MITRPVIRFECTGLFSALCGEKLIDDRLGNCEAVLRCMGGRVGAGLSGGGFKLVETMVDLFKTCEDRRDVAGAGLRLDKFCDLLRQLLLCTSFHLVQIRSTVSTTPMIAESIAAPGLPVAAVEADQPS